MRTPLQGIKNIIRFNWHYYLAAIISVMVMYSLTFVYADDVSMILDILCILILTSTIVSLSVSAYVYDFTGLYKMKWLANSAFGPEDLIVNINAGFDETSELLKQFFPQASLAVFDFYDPQRHTEISIRRARKAYPPFPGTQNINTNAQISLPSPARAILLTLSAHEIRNDDERTEFFRKLRSSLNDQGVIYVTEHLRDSMNFLAYNIGAFHFHSRSTWLQTFADAGLQVDKELKHTPFITTFVLSHNGDPS